jgi:hypothetical protein
MVNNRESGQALRARRWLSAVMAGSLGLGAAFFAGCSQTPVANAPQPADPLHGVLTPPGMPQPTNAPKAAVGWNPPPNQQFGVGDSSSTNNATLAGMTWQGPLGKPLAIDDNNKTPTPGQLTTSSKTQPTQQAPGVLPPNPNPKVEAIPDAKPTVNPTVTPTGSWQPAPSNPPGAQQDAPTIKPVVQTVGASSGAVPSVSNDSLDKQLQDRGVINQKVDQVPDGVKLTCYVGRPGGGFRILEATALDYNRAAQAIIQQIDTAKQ